MMRIRMLSFFRLLLFFAMPAALACTGQHHPAANSGSSTTGQAASTTQTAQPSVRSKHAGNLRILSYNVLRYGCGCQADNATLHGYLRSIIHYANPDIAGLVKVDAIRKAASGDGDAPVGFADSILDKGMNAAFPGRYAVCPFTNAAGANNVNLLFYDQAKLGFAGMQTLVSDETDFNLYKLYLRSSVSGGGSDTQFLYIILNHTESGDKEKKRDRQMTEVMSALHQRFTKLPAIIDMGDFNLRNTEEAGYQGLVADADPGFRFADPPFALDHSLKYPADWESNPDAFAQYLTTSTRKKEDKPNECGTGGGAKFWFDHILLSPLIAGGGNRLHYVPHSFRVVGNDGNRTGRSANADKHPNTAVPEDIAEAIFQLSNKYPVMAELEVQ